MKRKLVQPETCLVYNIGLLSTIGFAVVEPFVSNSFFATASFIRHGQSLRFSDYFDINNWNRHIAMEGYAKPLVPAMGGVY